MKYDISTDMTEFFSIQPQFLKASTFDLIQHQIDNFFIIWIFRSLLMSCDKILFNRSKKGEVDEATIEQRRH